MEGTGPSCINTVVTKRVIRCQILFSQKRIDCDMRDLIAIDNTDTCEILGFIVIRGLYSYTFSSLFTTNALP